VSDGPNYLVHQPDGTTFGPADVSMLKQWIAAGIVTRTTALSIQGDERRIPATVVPGLFEPEHQGHATTQTAEPMYQAHLTSGATDALTLADLGRMVESGDVVSTTPISLVGGSKRVPAAVVPGLEALNRTRQRDESSSCNLASELTQPTKEPVGLEQPAIDSSADEMGQVQAGSYESIQGDERRTSAAVVPGLFEQEHQVQTTLQSAEPMYQAHLASGTTDALTFADLSRLVEAGDVVPETPISLVGGSKKVSAVVVPRLFIKALEENPWTEAPAGLLDSDSEDYFTNTMVFVVTLVIAFIALAVLTKTGWPQKEQVVRVLQPGSNDWIEKIVNKVSGLFLLLVYPIVGPQYLGSSTRTWITIPGVWCMVGVATLTIRSHIYEHFGKRHEVVDDIKAWWKYIFGLVLGLWYAALLSLICFGPHPMTVQMGR